MKLAIMQPYFLPYLGYFNLLFHSDIFVLYNDINYIERGWINRNKIIKKDGFNLFTIPLRKASATKLISDIYISDEQKWRSKLLKTIEITYVKAPYFNSTYNLVEKIVLKKIYKLDEFIKNSITEILNFIELEKGIIFSSDFDYDRNTNKENKLVSITRNLQANTLVFPPGSRDLYSETFFIKKDINTEVIIPNLSKYKQFKKNEFTPGLSIVDVLMFNDIEEVKKLFNDYKISNLYASL